MSLDLVSQVKPQMHDEGVGCEGALSEKSYSKLKKSNQFAEATLEKN